VTSYTRYYGLPHPTATLLPDGSERFNDDANGARDLQSLAEATDRQLDRVSAAWVAEISKPAEVLRLAVDITGLAANTDNTFFVDTLVKGSGGMADTQNVNGADSRSGWFHYEASVATIPSGASTGVRRLLKAWVVQNTANGLATVEEYLQEEFETGSGEQVNHLSFVTFLDTSRSIWLSFFHNNPSSTLTIKNSATYLSAYRISPRT
jgi:hypothetical protein